MIITLLLGLFVATYSGLKVYAIEEGEGPLARQAIEMNIITSAYADDDEHEYAEQHENDEHEKEGEEFWEEIHEASANFVLLLVVMHIAGVVESSRLHRENRVKAIITGKKTA